MQQLINTRTNFHIGNKIKRCELTRPVTLLWDSFNFKERPELEVLQSNTNNVLSWTKYNLKNEIDFAYAKCYAACIR